MKNVRSLCHAAVAVGALVLIGCSGAQGDGGSSKITSKTVAFSDAQAEVDVSPTGEVQARLVDRKGTLLAALDGAVGKGAEVQVIDGSVSTGVSVDLADAEADHVAATLHFVWETAGDRATAIPYANCLDLGFAVNCCVKAGCCVITYTDGQAPRYITYGCAK